MSTVFAEAVGPMPDPRSLAWLGWYKRLVKFRDEEVPRTQGSTQAYSDSDTTSTIQTFIDSAVTDVTITLAAGSVWRIDPTATEYQTRGAVFDLSNRPNITIRAAGSGPKPVITGFSEVLSPGTTWTQDGANNNYSATTTSNTYAFCRRLDTEEPLRKVASQAECQSTPNSWFHNGTTTIYVHLTEGTDPDTENGGVTIELAPDGSTVSGILGSGHSLVRAEGIKVEGFSGGVEYGIRLDLADNGAAVYKDCEAYYLGNHCLGTAGVNGGGKITFIGCRTGFMTGNDSATVAFQDAGSIEYIVHECRYAGGMLPATTGVFAPQGKCHFAHCNTNNVNLGILYRAEQECTRGLDLEDYGHGEFAANANQLAAATIADATLIQRDCVYGVITPHLGRMNESLSGPFGHSGGIAHINGRYRVEYFGPDGNDFLIKLTGSFSNVAGIWFYNCDLEYDFKRLEGPPTVTAIYQLSTSLLTFQLHHIYCRVKVNGFDVSGTFFIQMMSLTSGGSTSPSLDVQQHNNLFVGDEPEGSTVQIGMAFVGDPDWPDAASRVDGNAWVGNTLTGGTTQGNNGDDANAVTLPYPIALRAVVPEDDGYETGQALSSDFQIEFDMVNQPRQASFPPSMGPIGFYPDPDYGGHNTGVPLQISGHGPGPFF